MRRFDLDRHAPACLFAVLLGAFALAAPSLQVGVAPQPDTSPLALAGRWGRASAPGTYVDLRAPLEAYEARLVEGYRDALGRPLAAGR